MTWYSQLRSRRRQIVELDDLAKRRWLWGCAAEALRLLRENVPQDARSLEFDGILDELGALLEGGPAGAQRAEELAAEAYEYAMPGIPELSTAVALMLSGDIGDERLVIDISSYIGNSILDSRILHSLEEELDSEEVDRLEDADPVCMQFQEFQLKLLNEERRNSGQSSLSDTYIGSK